MIPVQKPVAYANRYQSSFGEAKYLQLNKQDEFHKGIYQEVRKVVRAFMSVAIQASGLHKSLLETKHMMS